VTDPRAHRIAEALASEFPEVAAQLRYRGAEVIAELLEPERPWVYCHEALPSEDGTYRIATHWRGIVKTAEARFRAADAWPWSYSHDRHRAVLLDIIAWQPLSAPPPLTPEALACLEKRS
jgi:hypothetical protein